MNHLLRRVLTAGPGLAMLLAMLLSGAAQAQFGRGGPTVEWSAARADAQGSLWLRSDAFISLERMRAKHPVFELQWKLKLANQQRQLNSLTPAVTVGGAGRFPVSIIGGSSNNFHAFDNHIGLETWDRQFEAPTGAGTTACPGGIVAAGARPAALIPASLAPPPVGLAASGGNFVGGVGEPGKGVPPQLLERKSLPGAGRTTPSILKLLDEIMTQPAPTTQEGRGGPAGRGESAGFAGAYVVSADGVLHSLGVLQGKEVLKPVPFLPPNARASDLVAVNDLLYTATSNDCGGVPNSVWAMDLAGDDKKVTSWNTKGGSPIGAPTVATNGTVYIAIGPGPAGGAADGYSNAVVALDAKTLAVKDWFAPSAPGFTTAPVIFQYKGRETVAIAGSGGRIYLLDAASLGGADHKTPLSVSSAVSTARSGFKPAALASWEDASGTRWILEPTAGPIPAAVKIQTANGAITSGAVIAYKVTGENSKPALEPAWVSRNMVSPLAPIIVNGVIFAASSGEYYPAGGAASTADRISRSVPAVVYALDPETGKELWNSGKSVTSFVHSGGLWAGSGQVYLATYDNTVYAFGHAMGRR